MDVKDLVQHGNSLQMKIVLTDNHQHPFTCKPSPVYIINGVARFQLKVTTAIVTSKGNSNIYINLVFIKFIKQREDDDLHYTIKLTSPELRITNKVFKSDEDSWRWLNDDDYENHNIFNVNVKMDVEHCVSPFSSLYEDTELTDFELQGEDGSVHIHRLVLAACSPVLRRMLGGTWRETKEGHVDIPGTSCKTLQHLKDYIYLHRLPETGLEQLLVLASYYIMSDLEQNCINKLVNTLTAENACVLIEFSTKHKVKRLLLTILDCVQNGDVRVNEIREHFMHTE